MRRERTHLQHEVDILSQKMTQELMSLKDDLKGMFDDRKMDVRMEQRTMERAVRIILFRSLLHRSVLMTSHRSKNSTTRSPSPSTATVNPRLKACGGF